LGLDYLIGGCAADAPASLLADGGASGATVLTVPLSAVVRMGQAETCIWTFDHHLVNILSLHAL